MNVYFRIILIASLIGLAKAHIKIIVLATLGLMGLYLAHLLAQDYQNITRPAQAIKHLLGKRSLKEPEFNWDLILSNDPIDCFKSFLCQISVNPNDLNAEEKSIWNTAKNSEKFPQIIENFTTPMDCFKKFHLCPFDKNTMITLIRHVDIWKRRKIV